MKEQRKILMAKKLSRLCSFKTTTRKHLIHGSITSQEFHIFLKSLVVNLGKCTKVGDGFEMNHYSQLFRNENHQDFQPTDCLLKTLNGLNLFLKLIEEKLGKTSHDRAISKEIFVQGFCFNYDYFSMLFMIEKGFINHDFMVDFLIEKYGLFQLANLLELSRRQVGEALFFRGFFDRILENQ